MNKNNIQTQDTEKKKILTKIKKIRFRRKFSEDLFPNFSLDNTWVSTVKDARIRS